MKSKFAHNNKLNEDQVREIWRDLQKGKKTIQMIADEYGVNRSSIYDIRKGRTWADVYEEFNSWSSVKNGRRQFFY